MGDKQVSDDEYFGEQWPLIQSLGFHVKRLDPANGQKPPRLRKVKGQKNMTPDWYKPRRENEKR